MTSSLLIVAGGMTENDDPRLPVRDHSRDQYARIDGSTAKTLNRPTTSNPTNTTTTTLPPAHCRLSLPPPAGSFVPKNSS
jgi:hypothetical protein